MPIMMRALIMMFESVGSVGKKGTLVKGGKAYVTKYGVLEVIRKTLEEKVAERSMESCLNSLAVSMDHLVEDGKQYTEVDLAMVSEYALTWGIPAKKIRKILASKEKGRE